MAAEATSYTQRLARAIDIAYQSYKAGGPNSEDVLYASFLAQANNIVRYRLRGDGIFQTLARDITHSAMMALPHFREDSKLSTWFYTIAQNEVNSALREHIEARNTSDFIDHPSPSDSHSNSGDPALLTKEAQRISQRSQTAQQARMDIEALRRGLPPEQNQVIALSAEGHSLEAIAKLEGKPIGTIRSRFERAKRKMADIAKNIGLRLI
jgi:RNA polymerase sigma factor (sigma-70 family)